MGKNLEEEINEFKDFVKRRPFLEKVFEDEIKVKVREHITKRGWIIFMTGLIFGLLLGYAVGMMLS